MGWLGFGNNKSSTAGKQKKEDTDASLGLEKEQLKDGKSEGVETASASTVVRQAPASAPLPPQTQTSVFEFGSAGNIEDRVTLAGYCSVSDELEPCQWEILPSGGVEAPLFRIIF
ncbi:hypothetical protein MPTK1_7g00140 [Marchantia polymorpha subsp. ruderalis]|uniref:Uncharacterized protein n=2 Tax=Marchantia polymorpha TaxID=3197 RepID=A0AAF6BUM3_MARPO|nr:hypothetical protein MARPO_0046s0110 [Marchantia polymorpha]BBN15707.1 hypothetical protein Mp_7g00140 [Marchantia polymorpha subsp. ruderalis]|eukprot:PTQ39300.1 hypothetical protein MARPO_0046s0110 [Marchantia polymorpha]